MNALDLAAARPTDHVAAVRRLGQRWVGEEALAIGLYAALTVPTFRDVLTIAANHNGDSDSTAAIAGQLWGAWHGIAAIPHDWAVTLDVFAPLVRLFAAWQQRRETDEAPAAN